MPDKFKKRVKTMKQARELGRCLCSSPAFPFECACRYFREFNICKCAGEKLRDWDTQDDWAKFNLTKK